MVLAVVGALTGLIKSQNSSTKVDSRIFRAHYKWTTALLFGSAAFLAATEYFGDPIKCKDATPAAETYCWISGIYSLSTKTAKNQIKPYAAHGSSHFGLGHDSQGDPRFHSYYQWVPIILFIQGCLFYLPHFLWKINEGRHIKSLLQGLQFVKLDESSDERIGKIVQYILRSKGKNSKYFVIYTLFEMINFINVVSQIFILDSFFQGAFKNFGTEVLSDQYIDINDRRDVLISLFPRISKCSFHTFGPSGSLQKLDYICILPQNMLNEKIFIVVWFWFIILATLTGLHVILRFTTFFSKQLRIYMFDLKGRINNNNNIKKMIEKLDLGEYFLLSHLRMNLTFPIFEQLLLQMAENESGVSEDDNLINDDLPRYNSNTMMMDTLDAKKRNFGE